MGLDAGVARLKHDLRSNGELLLAGRLNGLQGMDAVKLIFEIITKELLPQCVGMTDFWQLRAYLDYLFKIDCYSADHTVSVAIYEMFQRTYDGLKEIDENFYRSSSNLGPVRSWFLQVLIVRWGATSDQEEACRVFRRVRETARETDRPVLDEIKDLVRKHDGVCSPEKIEAAIVNMMKDLPCENTQELILLLSHRWVKGLNPEQIAFLASVESWASRDTEADRPLMHAAILRATGQIREAWKAARQILVQLVCNSSWENTHITFLGHEEVCLRIDLEGSPSREQLMPARDEAVAYVRGREDLRFQDLVCRIYVSTAGSDSASEGRVTWSNWQATPRNY